MSEPNRGWTLDDMSDEENRLTGVFRAETQRREENNPQTGISSGLWNSSDLSSEPMIQDNELSVPINDFNDELYQPPSTSSGAVEGSRGSRSRSLTRGTRTRYRSNTRVTFGFSRGRGRGDGHSGQEQTRGRRSRGRRDVSQARDDLLRGRGRSLSVGRGRNQPPMGILDASADEQLNTIMNTFSMLYIASSSSNSDDSYKP